MAESIPGGAYLNGDRWVDANGKPLTRDQIAQAQQLHAEQQQQRDADNLAILEAQARNDPLARSLAHALRPQPLESVGSPRPDAALVGAVGQEVADRLAAGGVTTVAQVEALREDDSPPPAKHRQARG